MRPRWVVPAVVAAVVLLVGTVILAVVRAGRDDSRRAAPPPPSYDPPATFTGGNGVPLPREMGENPLPMVLDGFDAYVALPSGLRLLDTRTGQVRLVFAPREKPAAGTPPRAPVVVTLGGRRTVVGAFQVQVPGHGTTLGHDAVELVAVDLAEHRRVSDARIDLPPSLSDAGRLRAAWVAGAGSIPGADTLLVVGTEVGPARTAVSYGVDLATGRRVWGADGLGATAVTGGLAVGAQRITGGQAVGAVSLTDGRRAWATGNPASSVTVWPAGPSAVAGLGVAAGNGERVLSLVDATTGRVLQRRAVGSGVGCRFDGRLTTVCSSGTAESAWAAAFDASSGRTLWELPDAAAGRVAPRVSTAWHGVVYGTTTNGPVTLDARTGVDRPGSPGVAPDLVNSYVGIVAATVERPRPSAHLATS